MIRVADTPSDRAARTNSRSRRLSTIPRTIRACPTQDPIASTTIKTWKLGPETAMTEIAKRRKGKDSWTSVTLETIESARPRK